MMNIGVLASGRGTNLQSIIDSVESGYLQVRIAAVISDNRDAGALVRAQRHDLRAEFIDPGEYGNKREYEGAVINTLEEAGVELVILAGYMRLLSPYFVDHYEGRIMNIHPSLLPAFPGLDAQRQALDYGVKVSGCTVHFVDQGMDTGPIILQQAVPVREDDTEDTLAARILKEEHRLYPRAIKLYNQDRLIIENDRVKIRNY